VELAYEATNRMTMNNPFVLFAAKEFAVKNVSA
jgi:hypothetical protein